jgi:hypothetical protein
MKPLNFEMPAILKLGYKAFSIHSQAVMVRVSHVATAEPAAAQGISFQYMQRKLEPYQ